MKSNRATMGRRTTLALGVAVLLPALLLASCATLPLLVPPLLSFAQNMLNTAGKNQSADYVGEIQSLLTAFVNINQNPGQPPNDTGAPSYGGGAPSTSAMPLELDAALIKSVGGRATTMRDGETLYSDNGDSFKISFRPNMDCNVYVVMIDATGFVQPLWPDPKVRAAPFVRGGQEVMVPNASEWYGLDKNIGVETIYVVAARQRSAEIEETLGYFSRAVRPRSAPEATVSTPAVVPGGVAGSRPGSSSQVRTRSGNSEEVDATTYFSEAGADLVITRWFDHR